MINRPRFELESKVIQAFRQDNVRGNTIHFDWDRMPETPADYILKVITRNVTNGQLFLLKKIEADTKHKCLKDMLHYLENDMADDNKWDVKWTCGDNIDWVSHFVGEDEEEIRDKFYFGNTDDIILISIDKL